MTAVLQSLKCLLKCLQTFTKYCSIQRNTFTETDVSKREHATKICTCMFHTVPTHTLSHPRGSRTAAKRTQSKDFNIDLCVSFYSKTQVNNCHGVVMSWKLVLLCSGHNLDRQLYNHIPILSFWERASPFQMLSIGCYPNEHLKDTTCTVYVKHSMWHDSYHQVVLLANLVLH